MKGKQIINLCPNFYKIINFDVFDGDNYTGKLIRIYQEYIFNIDLANQEDVDLIIKFDTILGKYIDDYIFRKELQDKMLTIKVQKNTPNILETIIKAIIKIFDTYQEDTTKVIYISRWV